MWSSFSEFCKSYDLSVDEKQLSVEKLDVWKQVFESNISQDIVFEGKDPFALVHKYYQLSKDYIENFLLNVPDDLLESLPISEGDNAVHYAAKKGYHYFIEHSCAEYVRLHPNFDKNFINLQNSYGMRALHLAAGAGHVHTVKILLSLSADASLENNNKALPSYFAAKLPMRFSMDLKNRKEAILKLLFNALRMTNNNDKIDVHLLAAFGYKDLLKTIIEEDKTLLSVTDGMQHFPIYHAILNNRYETVECLLSLIGDDSYLVDFEGQRPIHYAALRGTKEMVKLCCEKRPQDIKKTDVYKRSALNIAQAEHNQEAQEVLNSYYTADEIQDASSMRHSINK